MLKVGDKAPQTIKLHSTTGEKRSLDDYSGKIVVLYFYPKDATPGCTKQACNFRDLNEEISNLEAVIIGVSSDSIESHQKFIKSKQLNFELWSDPDHKLQKAFGAWGEKTIFGKKFTGTIRSTFIIGANGKIVKSWEKASARTNPAQVLNWLEKNT